jgi:hypothetical protein
MSIEDDSAATTPQKKKSVRKEIKSKTATKAKKAKKAARAKRPKSPEAGGGTAKFPRHTVEKALRIPKAIIEQNAGKECSEADAATYAGVGLGGPFRLELSSASKYGFLSRPQTGFVEVTDRARQAIRPQKPGDDIEALRQAVLDAPEISEVYKHYRGEDLPDGSFFEHALVDKFKIPAEKVPEFVPVFMSSLRSAQLLEQRGDKFRILDVTSTPDRDTQTSLKKTLASKIAAGDSCFVVMPFGPPIGSYYQNIYEPAIQKAGLRAVRADTDIFGTGKIIDQIWSGINSAKVLVAELTTRNPNVFYELGFAVSLSSEACATCFPTAFELEKGNREKNIEQILAFGRCVKSEERARVGKWFCFVEDMAGIQENDQKQKTVGRIKPANEKFFVTIKEVDDDKKRTACEWGEFGLSNNLDAGYANACLANYEIEFSPATGFFNSSADSYHFGSESTHFVLYGTNKFSLFRDEAPNTYVSHGRCEKLN